MHRLLTFGKYTIVTYVGAATSYAAYDTFMVKPISTGTTSFTMDGVVDTAKKSVVWPVSLYNDVSAYNSGNAAVSVPDHVSSHEPSTNDLESETDKSRIIGLKSSLRDIRKS